MFFIIIRNSTILPVRIRGKKSIDRDFLATIFIQVDRIDVNNIKGVDQDEGLAKMLDSESSSEDEDKKKKVRDFQ